GPQPTGGNRGPPPRAGRDRASRWRRYPGPTARAMRWRPRRPRPGPRPSTEDAPRSLDRAQRQAPHEVLLDEDREHDDRQRADETRRAHRAPVDIDAADERRRAD